MKFCPDCGTAMSEPKEVNEATAEVKAETNTVATMPEARTAPPPGTAANAAAAIPLKVENHLVKAIISTLCCCLPFGIAAIIFAMDVKVKLAAGDVNAALEASKKANMWGNLAIGVGALFTLIYFVAWLVLTFMEL
jgi:hypothetical protein